MRGNWGSRSWNRWSHHSRHQKKRAMDEHMLASSQSPLKQFRALTKLRWIFPHQLAWWTTFSTGMLSPRSSWILSLWQPLLTIVGWWQMSWTITGSLAKPLASAIRGQNRPYFCLAMTTKNVPTLANCLLWGRVSLCQNTLLWAIEGISHAKEQMDLPSFPTPTARLLITYVSA